MTIEAPTASSYPNGLHLRTMQATPDLTDPSATSPGGDVAARGRRRTRDFSDGVPGDEYGDVDDGPDPTGSKRRRRSRKGLDKKFECPHEGCGKTYSRAEHLYRHQLNHNPKQIYFCDHPGCDRSFVRQDLCTRHKERHTAKGSHLQRKDQQMLSNISTTGNKYSQTRPSTAQNAPAVGESLSRSNTIELGGLGNKNLATASPASANASSGNTDDASPSLNPTIQSPIGTQAVQSSPALNQLSRSRSDEVYQVGNNLRSFDISSTPANAQRHQSFGSMDAPRTHPMSGYVASYGNPPGPQLSPPTSDPTQQYARHEASASISATRTWPPPATPTSATPQQMPHQYNQYGQPHQGFTPTNQATFPMSHNGSYMVPEPTGPVTRNNSVSEDPMVDPIPPAYSFPVLGDAYNRSPYNYPDDFTAWLLNDQGYNVAGLTMSSMHFPTNVGGSASVGLQAPYFTYDPLVAGQQVQGAPPQHPMTVNSIIESNLRESQLSEEKRQQILDLINDRFSETDEVPLKRQKDDLLEGDLNADSHVFSLRMMQTYIASYWAHFHPQMPILHRPTYTADGCPDLLLIAMMALGASCLEKSHGEGVTRECHDMANFLSWHLRWLLFQHAGFRPPAKLWVFQSLLLLEIFEKLYSTRPLHERAHIHHATTLTLMRRGSSLIGRSPIDSPPSVKSGHAGSVSSVQHDGWWDSWITNEATRRVAFAAFVMDSTHATMFGHSAVMVAHEIRLPLPCDESLWNATSGAEVGRQESALQANGIKPVMFLDGLKRTLHGQSVRTNTFGRVILMAGLLSVSWHMNQRDLQLSSLGAAQTLGGRDRWRTSLTRSFDFWKRDFDEVLRAGSAPDALNHSHPFARMHAAAGAGALDEGPSEARTVYHHLAHMAMQVDIVDCQIFAGASRLLGRSISQKDYLDTQRRMKETWAPTARARDATFYALRFLAFVLLPGDSANGNVNNVADPDMAAAGFFYNAREDFLLYRPWVLYFAALIVWSYGYSLDGPIVPPSAAPRQISLTHGLGSPQQQQQQAASFAQVQRGGPPTKDNAPDTLPPACPYPVHPLPMAHAHRVADMVAFLKRVGGVQAPEALQSVKDRNGCVGLLLLLRDNFRKTRWELLHEASNLLSNCAEMLIPGAGTAAVAEA